MKNAYYITRREHWSREDGPEIYRAEWDACVDGDSELSRPDDDLDPVSWKSHADVFRLEGGNIIANSTSADVLSKMLELSGAFDGRVMDQDGVVYVHAPRPSTGIRQQRRVIPRAVASLLLSIVGLSLLGIAMMHLFFYHQTDEVSLRGASLSFVTPPLVGMGSAFIVASILLAITSLYPWDRRWSKFAIAALILDVLPLLFIS